MNYKHIYYPESRFGGFSNIDPSIAFYIRVNSLIRPSSVVLDVGCGGGNGEDSVEARRSLRILRGKCAKVIGIDVDIAGKGNSRLDEFRLIDSVRWPVDDSSVDVCVCDHVLEHVTSPDLFFSECRRVLRKSGILCIRTSNALHFVSIFARLVPNKLHALLLSKIWKTRKKEDIFPTYYRCNTKRRIRKTLDEHGFEHCVFEYPAEPLYLAFSRLSYLVGVIYQKYAPHLFQAKIFAFANKK